MPSKIKSKLYVNAPIIRLPDPRSGEWSFFSGSGGEQTDMPETMFPVALERIISAPEYVDGSNGINRTSAAHISADNDIQAIRIWLYDYADSPNTQRSYTKESERLFLWAALERGKPISSLTADDFQDYFAFLECPMANWVNPGRIPKSNDQWRPLRSKLTDKSIRQARIILKAFFTWLVDARYINGNPIALTKRRRQSAAKKPTHYLQHSVWDFLLSWANNMSDETIVAARSKARGKFIVALFYITAARLSEAAGARMGDITQDDNQQWWWAVTGKGQKDGVIPVTQELIEAIREYRTFYGLSPLPSPGEKIPLILHLGGPRSDNRLISDNMVYRAMKAIYQGAADAAKGLQQYDIAARLEHASTHWMRHTAITHQADAGIDLRSIRENARHGTLATTSIYLGQDDQARHDETSLKHRLRSGE